LEWAFERGDRVFFFPDQHLGRNTALKMNIDPAQMPVWDPYQLELGGNTEAALEQSRVILWKGPLQRSPNVSPGARGSVSQQISRHQNPCASRMPSRSERHCGCLGQHRQDHSNGAR
jgi:hypothetical protein